MDKKVLETVLLLYGPLDGLTILCESPAGTLELPRILDDRTPLSSWDVIPVKVKIIGKYPLMVKYQFFRYIVRQDCPKVMVYRFLYGSKQFFDCPKCGESLNGLDAEGLPCDDCANKGKSCHHCGWDVHSEEAE